MHRIFSASAVVLLFGLTPGTGIAATGVPRPIVIANPAVAFVDGWWEQEHRDDARDRYWRLPHKQVTRYNRLQADTNRREAQRRKIDDDNKKAQDEQHRLLGYSR